MSIGNSLPRQGFLTIQHGWSVLCSTMCLSDPSSQFGLSAHYWSYCTSFSCALYTTGPHNINENAVAGALVVVWAWTVWGAGLGKTVWGSWNWLLWRFEADVESKGVWNLSNLIDSTDLGHRASILGDHDHLRGLFSTGSTSFSMLFVNLILLAVCSVPVLSDQPVAEAWVGADLATSESYNEGIRTLKSQVAIEEA